MDLRKTEFLGFDLSHINIPAALLTFFLSLITFIGLGIFSAAGTILFKQGEPFSLIFGSLSFLLGGAAFPIAILPFGLKIFSYLSDHVFTRCIEVIDFRRICHTDVAKTTANFGGHDSGIIPDKPEIF